MSERKEAFDLLLEYLSGRFKECSQKRVNKEKLLELLYSRIGSEYQCFTELVDDYFRLYGNHDRDELLRALRRALTCLGTWIRQYYARHPNHQIKFEIHDCCQLRAIVVDGFEGRSLISLVNDVDALLREISETVGLARALFDGKSACQLADEFACTSERLSVLAQEFRRTQSALKRRA